MILLQSLVNKLHYIGYLKINGLAVCTVPMIAMTVGGKKATTDRLDVWQA